MNTVKIAFIGAGNMGQMAHLRHYANMKGCRVAALFEPRPHLAARVAARYGIAAVYDSIEQLIETEQPDGLVVPQPFDRHGGVVTPLYRFGLPILTEKPLAASIQVGQEMVAALQNSSATHVVGYHKRSDHASAWAKEKIAALRASGEWGRLKYLRVTMPPGDWISGGFDELLTSDESVPPQFQAPADPAPDDFSAQQYAEYTAFVNYYIHQVNLIRFLLGESFEPIFADENGVLLVGKSASGVTISLEMAPYSTHRGWDESALAGFENGYVKLDLPAPLATFAGRAESFDGREGECVKTEPRFAPEGAMRNQARHFCNLVRGETTPLCLAQDALEDLRIARRYADLFHAAQ